MIKIERARKPYAIAQRAVVSDTKCQATTQGGTVVVRYAVKTQKIEPCAMSLELPLW